MNEPPILPQENWPHGDPPPVNSEHQRSYADEHNPFAPVADLQTKHAPVAGVHLPGLFWLAVLVTGALFVGMIFVLPGLGVPATIALVAATIRVPLLQVRLSRQAPERPLPKPLLLLISSWALMLAAGFASCVAFCAICIPTGFAIFATNMDGNDAGFLLFGLSGLVGIGAFLLLFVWSLRLPA